MNKILATLGGLVAAFLGLFTIFQNGKKKARKEAINEVSVQSTEKLNEALQDDNEIESHIPTIDAERIDTADELGFLRDDTEDDSRV